MTDPAHNWGILKLFQLWKCRGKWTKFCLRQHHLWHASMRFCQRGTEINHWSEPGAGHTFPWSRRQRLSISEGLRSWFSNKHWDLNLHLSWGQSSSDSHPDGHARTEGEYPAGPEFPPLPLCLFIDQAFCSLGWQVHYQTKRPVDWWPWRPLLVLESFGMQHFDSASTMEPKHAYRWILKCVPHLVGERYGHLNEYQRVESRSLALQEEHILVITTGHFATWHKWKIFGKKADLG